MLLLERERLANSPKSERHDGFAVKPRSERDVIPIASNGSKPASSSAWTSAPQKSTISIPDRYRIGSDVQGRFLTCGEAPMMTVRVEKSGTLSARQARNFRPGTIFLGAATAGDPFIDAQKGIYQLARYSGRIWSVAPCEQAVLLTRQLGDLRTRDWTVLAQDVELVTILAVWVLLNHLRLSEEAKVRAQIMPLVRLEGVIHAQGPDAQDLTGFPSELLHSTSTSLKQLRRQESVFKEHDRWSEIDGLDYLADRLRAIDELVYSPQTFDGVPRVDELGRVEIGHGCIAVVCRSASGADAVERDCQRIYGGRLGVLIVQTAPAAYVVRQINRSLPATLERAYAQLNLIRRRAATRKIGGAVLPTRALLRKRAGLL
jgi:hypothetical protein